MSRSDRLSIFIGSSVEGLPCAKALQVNLDHACEVTIWHQGVFGLGGGTLEDLSKKLDQVDFAILVVTPDDLIVSRDREQAAPRDNVLLELGMCIGTLGRERSFLVYDRTAGLKLPSDLAGITPATYQPHSDGNLSAALGAASTQIEKKAIELGIRTKVGQVGLIDEHTQFRIIADLLGIIADNFLIQLALSGKFLIREKGHSLRMGRHWYAIEFPNRHIGNGRFSVNDLCEKLLEADIVSQNLSFQVVLTPRGQSFVQWLLDNGYKAKAFRCNLGGWGDSEWFMESSIEMLQEGSESYD
ncbi:nucleotide-binding protein [Marinobacter daepoensis]|uniref:Nucleotide-binding protein n=1 Tax=Marinobacter daepoensis TaxID=262077 RepID=A0ABS3BIJ4_9GAMM|nr:nucleotide-binding protein [Marinobacter daepoensis]MBN7771653.1 nucleotide-binding protein [Marinobacter daepoensis]MBY6080952.1 nucleotide-binding protein [Marinobacter daepoensis]